MTGLFTETAERLGLLKSDLPPHVIKALRHARIDVAMCIAVIEDQGNGDACEGLRETLALIDAALLS